VGSRPDRLARSVADLLAIHAKLAAKGVALRILSMDMDTRTATGMLTLSVLAAVGEFERSLMLERQREGVARAKAEGRYRGRVPTAMRRADEVRRLKAEGLRPMEIVRRTGLGRTSVYRILREPAAP
jgi:DNA invertase Pin-like site-specific DNA recombinase